MNLQTFPDSFMASWRGEGRAASTVNQLKRLALLAAIVALGPREVAGAVQVEAYAGRPFGVARVTLPVGGDQPVLPAQDERFTVSSPDGRALYPVLKEEPVRRVLRRLLNIDRPRTVTMYFLFTGDEPFDAVVYAPTPHSVRVIPAASPRAQRLLLEDWWRQYGNRWRDLRRDPQFPPVVENFLAANLSRRLGLPLPEPARGLFASVGKTSAIWSELFVTEARQLSIDQKLLLDPPVEPSALEPLPPPLPWFELPLDESLGGTAVEPISLHVPAECFYVRFGSFSNYFWFRSLNRKWHGDLANMIQRRAIDRAGADRVQQQLSLRETALAEFLGPQVISDVALIGLDPYLAHGGAIGILFQAKVNPLLAQDLTSQRRQALAKVPGATETTVRIADRDVSLIATPGGEVRSYYVRDGDFHLVANSRRLVQRFLLAGQGERALGASAGFLHMRKRLPVDRNDAVFAYFSPEFFRELTSPAIWIETQRRARSAREGAVLALARLQAAAEGIAATDPSQLVAARILPEGFGVHADGSRLEEKDGIVVDSVRGQPGIFVAVADMEVASVSPEEAAAYRSFADRFRQEVGQLPPIAAAVQRQPRGEDGETLTVELLATPLNDVKLGRLNSMLGQPSDVRIPPAVGDVIHAEFVLNAVLPLMPAEPHHLFAGIRDFRTPLVVDSGRIAPGAPPPELVRMYVGAWPKPGLIRFFLGEELAQTGEPVPGAQSTWQARSNDFLLISFKPDLVREVLPQLQTIPAERPAQAWIDVGDLTGTELSAAVNALGFQRAREAAVAAPRLMNTLINQLHVPHESARDVAEQLMGGKFESPLGGEYELVELPNGPPAWTTSALAPQNRFLLTAAPADFTLPLLTWFRGFRGEALLDGKKISGRIEIDMAAEAIP